MKERRLSRSQAIHGVLLLDKPSGMSSNRALQRVKRLCRARKAGHTGSLDPMASGLLPICLGEATKLSRFLLEADKRYEVECRLGARTTTGDAEGEIVETCPPGTPEPKRMAEWLTRFVGPQAQIPPMYSAVKHRGQPLYRLARQGIEVAREHRRVTVYTIKLIGLENDRLGLEVFCSKGTYIRTLVEEIGRALGCGAHVTALRRTQAGCFAISERVSLDDLEALKETETKALDTLLISLERALADWPAVDLMAEDAGYLRQGQAVRVPQAPKTGWVRLMERRQGFFGVGQVMEDGRIVPRRLIFA